MITSLKSFRRLANLSVIVCVAVPLLSSACDGPGVDPEPPTPPETDAGLVSYFSGRLGGGVAAYSDDVVVDPADIAAERAFVWEAWKKANTASSEEKLIDLAPLSEGNSGAWTIPADLEPNAVMNYYWGTKGSEPAAGYPLFLYLHGSGNRNSEWTGGRTLSLGFDDSPSVYFIRSPTPARGTAGINAASSSRGKNFCDRLSSAAVSTPTGYISSVSPREDTAVSGWPRSTPIILRVRARWRVANR